MRYRAQQQATLRITTGYSRLMAGLHAYSRLAHGFLGSTVLTLFGLLAGILASCRMLVRRISASPFAHIAAAIRLVLWLKNLAPASIRQQQMLPTDAFGMLDISAEDTAMFEDAEEDSPAQ